MKLNDTSLKKFKNNKEVKKILAAHKAKLEKKSFAVKKAITVKKKIATKKPLAAKAIKK